MSITSPTSFTKQTKLCSKTNFSSWQAPQERVLSGQGAKTAHDGDDRIVYDTRSGKLYYDKDGAGGHHAQLFAILDGSPDNISAKDFLIVT